MRGVFHYLSDLVTSIVSTLQLYLYNLIRPFAKWVLRRCTGLCELQRICYCEPVGARRIIGIEKSLRRSRSEKVKKLLQFLDRAAEEKRFIDNGAPVIISNTVETICSIKNIRPEVHQPFRKSFGECISVIWGLSQLLDELEMLRKTSFDSENMEHERKLLALWSHLMPGRMLESRITISWQDIGFQGTDPKTDFRGMGLLGLENLLFFAENYSDAARHVLSHSTHPKHGYSFAIVGINLTHLAFTLWKDGAAKSHIYNMGRPPALRHFHRFYCYLIFEFDKLWMKENPESIMEFNRIRGHFETQIRSLLADPGCSFKLTFPVEDI
uniref:EOG090X0AMT n=1 Tax=Alona affinis TaxID=381656 RepID=A0A9N6ZEW8_9CRUS|nr:EOG090X0AMT [Alona affinis]